MVFAIHLDDDRFLMQNEINYIGPNRRLLSGVKPIEPTELLEL